MFTDIQEYITKTKLERQAHLALNESCIDIGGDSREFRGLLSHFLSTTIPRKHKIHLCHACNNAKCSNVRHLYWGTSAENIEDQKLAGTYKNRHEKSIEKYGAEEYAKMQKEFGSKGGKASRKTSLSEDRILEIKLAIANEPKVYGFISKLERKLGVSHTQIRRYIKRFDL